MDVGGSGNERRKERNESDGRRKYRDTSSCQGLLFMGCPCRIGTLNTQLEEKLQSALNLTLTTLFL